MMLALLLGNCLKINVNTHLVGSQQDINSSCFFKLKRSYCFRIFYVFLHLYLSQIARKQFLKNKCDSGTVGVVKRDVGTQISTNYIALSILQLTTLQAIIICKNLRYPFF